MNKKNTRMRGNKYYRTFLNPFLDIFQKHVFQIFFFIILFIILIFFQKNRITWNTLKISFLGICIFIKKILN